MPTGKSLLCSHSHEARLVCIQDGCEAPAFICQSSQHSCPSILQHNDHTTLPIADFQRLREDTLRASVSISKNAIKEVTSKSEMVISQIRHLISRFVDRITEIAEELVLLPEYKIIQDRIEEGDFLGVKGKDASFFVQGSKLGTHFKNRQTKMIEIHCLIDKGYRLMQNVRKKINDFITRELSKSELPSINILPPPSQSGHQKLDKLCSKIKRDPNNPERYFQRGLEYAKSGKNKEAEEDYTMAIKLNPLFKDAYLNRGIILYNSARYKEAQSDYNKVIQLDPDNYKAFNNRGRLRHDLKMYKGAEEDYTRALAINPTFEKCLLNRGLLYQETSRVNESLNDLNLVLELSPNNSKARGNRGLICFSMGKLKEAQEDYNKALQLDPNDALFNNRGYLYFLQGQLAKALEDYTKAVSMKEKSLYFKNRSEVYLKLGMERQHKDDLMKAKMLDGKH